MNGFPLGINKKKISPTIVISKSLTAIGISRFYIIIQTFPLMNERNLDDYQNFIQLICNALATLQKFKPEFSTIQRKQAVQGMTS